MNSSNAIFVHVLLMSELIRSKRLPVQRHSTSRSKEPNAGGILKIIVHHIKPLPLVLSSFSSLPMLDAMGIGIHAYNSHKSTILSTTT